MNKIYAILEKEWLELRQQKSLVASLIFMPLLLTALPIIAMYLMGHVSPSDVTKMSNIEQFREALSNDPLLAGMSVMELSQAVIGKQLAMMFLLVPVFIPGSIAAYSIVGEKTRRTLEPLLAAPIRTWELMLAKSLAVLIPTLIITYVFGGVMIVGILSNSVSTHVASAIITPAWLLLFAIGTPLLTLTAITLTVIISSRANDPRTAQQLSAVLIIPIIGLVLGQVTGLVVLGTGVMLLVIAILIVIAVLSLYFATRIFERETILTHWG